MLVIGLTGGIGSGKTRAAFFFSARGVPVLDADVIARELVRPGTPALDEIVEAFGREVLAEDGALDRAALRARIFDDPEQRSRLEAILHPRVRTELQRRLTVLDAPYVILVIPLLVEARQTDLVDRILVVDVPVELQKQRAHCRDHLPLAAIEAIIDAQASREQRLGAADDVIYNDGTLEELEREVDLLHHRYNTLSLQQPSPGDHS